MDPERDGRKKIPKDIRVEGRGQRPVVSDRSAHQVEAGSRKRFQRAQGAQDLGKTSEMGVADQVNPAMNEVFGRKG